MALRERTPAWPRDVKWGVGIVAVIAVAACVLLAAVSAAGERTRAVPLLQATLRATLLPGEAGQALEVRRGGSFEPGESLAVVPSADVQLASSEVESMGADAALSRVAAVWTGRLLESGRAEVLAGIEPGPLRDQVSRALDGPAARLVSVALQSALLPAGLADGSRMANWPLQAQQNPGEPVQPYVGLFVEVDPEGLGNLDTRQIAETVVDELAATVVAEGAEAAREAFANATLAERFELGLENARAEVHELFETLLLAERPDVATRIEEARQVLRGEQVEPRGLGELLPEAGDGGGSVEDTNDAVLQALAERAWTSGSDALVPILEPSGRAARLGAAAPVLDTFSAAGRQRARAWAWLFGAAAALLLVGLILVSRGWARVANPGWVLLLGAGGGALLFGAWANASDALDGRALPGAPTATGAPAHAVDLALYLLGRVPAASVDLMARAHLWVAVAGAALLAVALVGASVGRLRPRRRRGYL